MNTLISIDCAYSFIAEDGKLTTGTAGRVTGKGLTAYTKKLIDQEGFAVFTIGVRDPKSPFHPESRLFPPHNVVGTSERELYGSLKSLYRGYEQEESVYWINRRHHSTFSGTGLDIYLRERQITDIYLAGVCIDVCVLHIVVDVYDLGYKLHIFRDTMASSDPAEYE